MSGTQNFSRINNNNKRPCSSSSKYLKSFLPDTLCNNEHQLNKKQKLDPDVKSNIDFTGSNDQILKKQNENVDKNTESIEQLRRVKSNVENPYSNKFSSIDNTSNIGCVQPENNSFLDDGDEWFNSIIANDEEKDTQAEADISKSIQIAADAEKEIRINVSSKYIPDINKKQVSINTTSFNSVVESKVTSLSRTTSGKDWYKTQNSVKVNQQNLTMFASKGYTEKEESQDAENKETEKLRNEIKHLEQKHKGEVSLLRMNLSKKIEEHIKDKENFKKEKETLKKVYERELQCLNSQLDVKKMHVVLDHSEQEFHPPEAPTRSCDDQEPLLLLKGKLKDCIEETQACQLLLELITPELFYKSSPEVTALDPPLLHYNPHLKTKGTISEKDSVYDNEINEKEKCISLRTCCYTLKSCHRLLISATKMVDLSQKQATVIFVQVLKEILNILEELRLRLRLSTLRERFMDREKEVYERWQTYVPLNREYRLLDFRPWYDKEKGVEARRSLGLLSILIGLSTIVVPVTANSTCKTNVQESETSQVLYKMEDIVKEIANQRRVIAFEGVLAGVVEVLLRLVTAEVKLLDNSQQIILNILKHVVFSRPGSYILLKVFEFLKQVVHYPFITNQLCNSTGRKTCVEYYWAITYNSDTCIVQILCFMIRQLPEDSRYKLTEAFISWLYPLFVKDRDGPPWLFTTPDSRGCQCRSLVSQLTVTLLVEVCEKYKKEVITDKRKLEKLLSDGVFLVQNLVYLDEHFPYNVGEYRGNLVLFLDEINNFKNVIDFHPISCNISEKLIKEEKLSEFSTVPVNIEEIHGLFASLLENVTDR